METVAPHPLCPRGDRYWKLAVYPRLLPVTAAVSVDESASNAPPNRYDTPSTNVNYLDTVRYLTFDVLLILFSFHKVQMTDLRRCASLSRHFLTFPMAS